MISGSIPPADIGLTDRVEIFELLKKTKYVFTICQLLSNIFGPITIFITVITIFSLSCSFAEVMVFGIIWTIHYSIWTHHSSYVYLLTVDYFYLICQFCRSRLREINNRIRSMERRQIPVNVRNIDYILESINSVYEDIRVYNNEVWSKYLLLSWAMYSILLNVMLFQAFLANTNGLLSLIFLSYASIGFGVLIFMMNSASAVNKEANRSHSLINSLILSNKTRRLPIGRRLKVFQLS